MITATCIQKHLDFMCNDQFDFEAATVSLWSARPEKSRYQTGGRRKGWREGDRQGENERGRDGGRDRTLTELSVGITAS